MPIVFAKPVLPPVWNISTCNFVSAYPLTGIEVRPMGMDWNDDGTKAYIIGVDTDRVHQFSLSTPYDFSSPSVTYDGIGESLDISPENANPQGGAFSDQGDFYYMIAITSGAANWRSIYPYELTIDWDISSGVYNSSPYAVNNPTNGATDLGSPTGLTFQPNGNRMYVTSGGNGVDGIYQFDISINWNVTTAVYNGVMINAEAGADGYSGIKFSPNGRQMFVTQRNGADVIQYDLTSAWDIATATYVPPECDASDDSIIMGLAFNPDGTEMYICGFADGVINKYTL